MSNLISCRACKQPVSRTAEFCPHCGETEPNQTVFGVQSIFTTIVCLIAIMVILYQCVS